MKLPEPNHENITIALISLGLPLITYLYIDLKAAFSVAVLIQIVIGLIAVRNS